VTVEPQIPIAANGFVSNPVDQITVDGSVGDWQGLEPFSVPDVAEPGQHWPVALGAWSDD